jgi:hypothetical protein
MTMGEKRLTNSELRLSRLEEEDAKREEEPGICEVFDDPAAEQDEDAPLDRDRPE